MLLVYSGLLTFFLIPFHKGPNSKIQKQGPITFKTIYKNSLLEMIFQRKSICALLLMVFMLLYIWLGYKQEEYHINAHSGYPPISYKLIAVNSMTGLIVYTFILYLFLAFVRSLKKNNR